ncbi:MULTISPECIES: helix-turn-helix domain-containing protein [unclassified Bartonella]|uniref:helix-turn-helix domain-containing protein n=1 Tax=unclassified Bartonella TaxID=2645622 RepID=UPI0015FC994D|nr:MULTISPECIES: helix-turn-helix transcriptional regulator [unclassified Bartonella]UXN03808.1 helix-turn-helix domain-containing protein [Bartonella sp. HY406]UXN06781.1 helix-turn-helix domain-containing protein [Bartonella sp. HY761]
MTVKKKQPDPIDVYVGSRIRLRRNSIGLSQEKLGEQLGITFQQVQKYEKGTNRVGASRLQAIAETLEVPVSFFFEDVSNSELDEGFAEAEANPLEMVSSGEGLQLIRAFTNIKDPKVRRKIIDLAKALSQDDHLEDR